jgi:predicted secreted protein
MRTVATLLLVALTAGIASVPSAPILAQGSGGKPGTRLTLSQSVAREVEQDTLVAVLTARAGAASAREAQAAVNSTMAAAVEQARAVEAVRQATGGYRVFQERDRNGQPRGWVAEQDLRLTARDATALLELAGALQGKGLAMNGLEYVLSAEARKALEDELTIEALAALRTRAERVAEAMAMRVEAIESLRLGGVGEEPPVRPMLRMQAAEAAAPPPVSLPDVETVQLSIDAEVRLSPR